MKLSDFSEEDYKILKQRISYQHELLEDLHAMHGVIVEQNKLSSFNMSVQELEGLKLIDKELPLELEDRLKEIIKTEKYDIIRDGEKEAVNCVGDLENEYSSGCCRCCRGCSCHREVNEMGV